MEHATKLLELLPHCPGGTLRLLNVCVFCRVGSASNSILDGCNCMCIGTGGESGKVGKILR